MTITIDQSECIQCRYSDQLTTTVSPTPDGEYLFWPVGMRFRRTSDDGGVSAIFPMPVLIDNGAFFLDGYEPTGEVCPNGHRIYWYGSQEKKQ